MTETERNMAERSRAKGDRREGVSLVEMLLVVTLMSVLMTAMVPALRAVNTGWKAGERRIEVVQTARAAMDETVRNLRQARRVGVVSGPGDTAGYLEYFDRDDALHRLDLVGENARFGPVNGQSLLAGPVNVLEFRCYDGTDTLLAAPVEVERIRSVGITLTARDRDSEVPPFTLRSRICMRRDAAVVINEIMYNPLFILQDRYYEWIELYNPSDMAYDLSGWGLTSSTNKNNPDILSGDLRFGTGSTLLPAGGYAVITSNDTYVHTELLTNRGFEDKQRMWVWSGSSSWSRSKNSAHEGNRKLVKNGSGWIYQTTYIPYYLSDSAFFSFWERSPSSHPENMRIIVTLRSLSDSVIATLYDGPMHADWTRHYANLTDYRGNIVRLRVETQGSGKYWIDDFSLSCTFMNENTLRICVDDDEIGGGSGLKDSKDTITLSQGGLVVDSVAYDDDWGGDGNARSIERISPTGASNDSGNWSQGPITGTAGEKNWATQ